MLTKQCQVTDSDSGHDEDFAKLAKQCQVTDSNRGRDEDFATVGCDSTASGSHVHVRSVPQHIGILLVVEPFTGDFSCLRIQEVPHMNKDSALVTFFLFFFLEVLVAETNTYYSYY
jgi:hypothetical protein